MWVRTAVFCPTHQEEPLGHVHVLECKLYGHEKVFKCKRLKKKFLSWQDFKNGCYIFILQLSLLPEGSSGSITGDLCQKATANATELHPWHTRVRRATCPRLDFFSPFSWTLTVIAGSKRPELSIKRGNVFLRFNIPQTALRPNIFITVNPNNIWILK